MIPSISSYYTLPPTLYTSHHLSHISYSPTSVYLNSIFFTLLILASLTSSLKWQWWWKLCFNVFFVLCFCFCFFIYMHVLYIISRKVRDISTEKPPCWNNSKKVDNDIEVVNKGTEIILILFCILTRLLRDDYELINGMMWWWNGMVWI